MNTQQKKNRRLILSIFAMSFIPFLIAWYLNNHPTMLKGHTNHGELIIPPISADLKDFKGFDSFSTENLKELNGHWILVNVIPQTDCQTVCLDALHKTRQLLLMMNKDLTRLRRMVVLFNDIESQRALTWWQDDTRLLRLKLNPVLQQQLNARKTSGLSDGMLFIMDPLGNIMMQYESGFDPYQVKDDLRKLLLVSQIG